MASHLKPVPNSQSTGKAVWAEDPLGFVIAPMSPETFFAEHYEKKPLLSSRGQPDRYADMLTLEKIDAFLNSADLRSGMVDLANHENRIPSEAYVNEGGRIITPVVAEEFMRGATIILPHLHESLAELGEFCRALESVFSVHVQTNIYLTPPGRQGFDIHYDNHDVFVLQIAGSKEWRFYGQPVTTPYRGEAFEMGKHDPGEVTETFTLTAGDCVYVPRGLMHAAPNVGDEASLHITVGLITKTWADLMLEAVSELALEEPAFRQSLPPGYANRDFDRDIAERHFAELVRLIGAKASMDNAFNLMADEFIRDRRPNLSGVIANALSVPKDGEYYRARPLLPWQVADDEGQLVLIGPGGDLEFPAGDGDALERALSGEPFTMADLRSSEDPAGVFRTLWANGYLERT